MIGIWLLIASMTAANDATLTSPGRCGVPLSTRIAAEAALEDERQVKNTIRLEDARLLWNGTQIDEPATREYLGQVRALNPQPLTVLTYSTHTSCERVQRTRLLMQNTLQCKSGQCLELGSSTN